MGKENNSRTGDSLSSKEVAMLKHCWASYDKNGGVLDLADKLVLIRASQKQNGENGDYQSPSTTPCILQHKFATDAREGGNCLDVQNGEDKY